MRYIPIGCVKEGMILGKTLYGEMGEILLREGAIVHLSYVKKMKELGYFGIYIEDELSEGIKVQDVISEDLKMKTVKAVRNFMQSSSDEKLVKRSFSNIENLIEDIVDEILDNKDLVVNMVDLKVATNYTFYHSVNVSVLALVLGVALKLDREELYLLGMTSLLHDMGKIFTPSEILDKPDKLTKEEYDEIKKHSQNGYRYVKEKLDVNTKVYVGIQQHHERFDGTGYPNGITGKKISLFGRVIAISDVFDALVSDRPYRKGILPSEGMEYIMGSGGTLFDPDIVNVFSKKIAPYPIGTCVILSNGYLGIVVKNYENYCLRPLVKIIKENEKCIEPYYINLLDSNYDVTIKSVADAMEMTS
ncbi:MAG: HD-GYP domain-containing protein [Clostridiaceae bacterium]